MAGSKFGNFRFASCNKFLQGNASAWSKIAEVYEDFESLAITLVRMELGA